MPDLSSRTPPVPLPLLLRDTAAISVDGEDDVARRELVRALRDHLEGACRDRRVTRGAWWDGAPDRRTVVRGGDERVDVVHRFHNRNPSQADVLVRRSRALFGARPSWQAETVGLPEEIAAAGWDVEPIGPEAAVVPKETAMATLASYRLAPVADLVRAEGGLFRLTSGVPVAERGLAWIILVPDVEWLPSGPPIPDPPVRCTARSSRSSTQ